MAHIKAHYSVATINDSVGTVKLIGQACNYKSKQYVGKHSSSGEFNWVKEETTVDVVYISPHYHL